MVAAAGGMLPTPEDEKRSRWEFVPAGGRWGWRVAHADGKILESAVHFATLKECADDAKAHGYVVWVPERRAR